MRTLYWGITYHQQQGWFHGWAQWWYVKGGQGRPHRVKGCLMLRNPRGDA